MSEPKHFVVLSEKFAAPSIEFASLCSCPTSIIIMSGKCQEHNKEWEARIDANYIKELIERVEKLEKKLCSLINTCQSAWEFYRKKEEVH